MAESETPSLVFLTTSFTMRERFTPARACSTLTRRRANFRFVRFSASVSWPPGGFFFRLAGFRSCWLVPLESGIFVQHRPRWEGKVLLIGDLLIVCLTGIGLAQEANALALQTCDDHVLVAVRLLLATVVQRLSFRAFWPLAAPLGPIDDEPNLPRLRRLALRKVTWVPLREHADSSESMAQDGQQPLNPIVHRRLAQTEEFGHDDLQRIGLEVDEEEQQLLFRRMQSSLASGTRGPLAGLASQGPVRGIQQFIGPCEGRQEMVKLRQGQASEGETFPPISLDFCIGNHRAMLSLFPIKSNEASAAGK